MPTDFDLSGLDVFAAKSAKRAEDSNVERVMTLDCEQVIPDPDNVRKQFSQVEIDDMAASIKERGQLMPIIVEALDDGRFQICFGERRWRACKQLGVKVRAVFNINHDRTARQIDQFIENDQRANLATSEIVLFVSGQLQQGMKVADLARMLGRDRATISRYASLADLPDYLTPLLDVIPLRALAALAQADRKSRDATEAFINRTGIDRLTVAGCSDFAKSVESAGEGQKTSLDPLAPPAPAPVASGDRAKASKGENDNFIIVSGKPARLVQMTVILSGEKQAREAVYGDGQFTLKA